MGSVTATPGPPREVARERGLTAAAEYGLLFLFGVLQGVVGSFHYGSRIGHVPVAGVGFGLAIGLTCVLCGRGMRSTAGALVPALGWLLAAFLLAMPRPNGSVVIANTLAGQVYLYAGALCAAIGAGVGLSGWTRGRALSERLPRSGRAPSAGRPR